MKILTVNVTGIPNSSSSNLSEANVFQDYDAVVVDPKSIEHLYRLFGEGILEDSAKQMLKTEWGTKLDYWNMKRRQEVDGLLQNGGVVVCFMEPFRRYPFRIEGDQLFITNYDWLMEPKELEIELGGINYGKGTTIDYVDSGHAFYEYLKTKPSWTASVNQLECSRSKWKILASAYGTHVVSLAKRVGRGHIVLLPSYYHYDNGKLLEQCIRGLLGGEPTPMPTWAKPVFVPGQEQILSKQERVESEIDTLGKQRSSLVAENEALERWKWLLYETGKYRLEPVVREALSLLGIDVEPQPDEGADGKLVSEFGTALLEVEGAEETVKIGKISQLIKNIGNFISEENPSVKGILVGNPFRLENTDNRPPKGSQKQLFSKELLEAAEKQNITVLLSTDLYEIVGRILKGDLSDKKKEALRRQIFHGKGHVALP